MVDREVRTYGDGAPADIVEDTLASIEAATDPADAAFTMLTDAGRILTYGDSLAF